MSPQFATTQMNSMEILNQRSTGNNEISSHAHGRHQQSTIDRTSHAIATLTEDFSMHDIHSINTHNLEQYENILDLSELTVRSCSCSRCRNRSRGSGCNEMLLRLA